MNPQAIIPEAIIKDALARKLKALSEFDSKRLLAAYGVPVTKEELASTAADAVKAARALGYPVVMKACGPEITHKTEHGLVEIGIGDDERVASAFAELTARAGGRCDILVQEMIAGRRELMFGMIRDPLYGPCVTFGLGGIFTEILDDVACRIAPFGRADAEAMLDEIRGNAILGAVRGMAAVDRAALCDALTGLARLALAHDEIKEIDVNPVIIADTRPIAVDALVVLG
ncbi:MAG: acetate--CoA ligase family protein [Proteobacteria bacterium]|nr:acetate--CoA ligase family protein [Pseudomonadota bacterium]